ncbi:SMP-30/gluconolactonase/LRE family protein [Hymenobacter sp. BT683]|uniref:Regucalcin n=1 Tax=Hymenobacter jeongseonensis TaxID=2791027 RepID=A0ABS0IEU6_9BACT|nr:SMP-30/gluconolactonase/LRE family protein [Hymenobacter jeongseonensis]MBF9236883.1 SMP-30/gluconolactonase/LRE family protein [Hymenobacter jeongseonensis]
MEAHSILSVQAALGEGPIWNPETRQLYWVDIEGRAFHVFDPKSGQDVCFPTTARVGAGAPMRNGNVLLALQTGLHQLDLRTGRLTLLTNPLTDPNLRFNDGKCDPAGRFWVGTFHLEQKPSAGTLYRFDPDGSLHVMLRGITNSNGIIWSLDQATMYYIDTPTLTVQAFDYDNATGTIANPRVIIRLPEGPASPDGMTIDAEGKLWVALWCGGAVHRYDPHTGALLQVIKVPAPLTSACAFGGPDLRTLYITTARHGLTPEQLAKFPLSGNLFALEPGVSGVPACFYGAEMVPK